MNKLCTFFLLCLGFTFSLVQAAPQAFEKTLISRAAPQIGEVVAQNNYLYRVLIKTSKEGYYVQNFYLKDHAKQSDVFLITELRYLNQFRDINTYNMTNMIFEGKLMLWRDDGNPLTEINVTQGKAEGLYNSYYYTGIKEMEGYYKQGKREGLWNFWTSEGQLDQQVYFKEDQIQWQKNVFNLRGL